MLTRESYHCFLSSFSLKKGLFSFTLFLAICGLALFLENLDKSTCYTSQFTVILTCYSLQSLFSSLSLGRNVLTWRRNRAVSGLLNFEGSRNRNSLRIYLEKDSCLGLMSTKERPLIILRSYLVSLINSFGSGSIAFKFEFISLKWDYILGRKMIEPRPLLNFFSVRLHKYRKWCASICPLNSLAALVPYAHILYSTGLMTLSNLRKTLIIFWLSIGMVSCCGS